MQDPTTPPPPVASFAHPLGPRYGSTLGDMRFMGWVTLVYGVLTCLTIIGAVLGVPVIIAAHRFIEAVNRLEVYGRSAAPEDLKAGFDELGRSFRILKVITIVYIVLTVLYLVFLFLLGGIGLLSELADG